MKKTVLLLLAVAVVSGGCAYTSVRRPLGTDYDKTELGTKEGKASTRSVLWLVAWGDGGSKAAAEDGGIKVIRHADVEYFQVLFGIYTRVTTVLYGD